MALSKEDERKKIALMKLGMSEQAALDVIDCDHEIDRNIPQDFDLDPETEKMAKKFANATTKKKPTVYEFTKRERKANPTKAGIISELAKFLEEASEYATENVEITNKERQIAFTIGEDKFELTLVQKRKPKG
jgi:predicted RND superfamily exporter protein